MHTQLYTKSMGQAVDLGQIDKWCESYRENRRCARAIDQAIQEKTSPEAVIAEFGFDRVNFVLANTLRQRGYEAGFSKENLRWSGMIPVPSDMVSGLLCVYAPADEINNFVDEARTLWNCLGLYNAAHCISESDGALDYKGKILAVSSRCLPDERKTPEDQLFLGQGGYGCSPYFRNEKLQGVFLKTGEQATLPRMRIIGVLKEEYIPQWAAEMLPQEELPQQAEQWEFVPTFGLSMR